MTARDRLVVIIVVALAILAGAWFMVIAPKRSEAGGLVSQIAAQKDALSQAQSNVTTNTQARATYNRDYATVAMIGKAVPQDEEMQSLLVQLQTAARKAKVDFREIDKGSSTVGPAPSAPTAATGAVNTANGASSSATGTTTSTTPAAPVSASSTTTLAPGSAIGASGVTTIPFTLIFQGNYFHLQHFIKAVQNFTTVNKGHVLARGRLLVIGSVNLVASAKGFPQIKATIQATAYQLPPDTTTDTATGATPLAGSTSGNQAAAASTTPSGTSAPAPAATASVGTP